MTADPPTDRGGPRRHFHVSRAARDRYGFDDDLFGVTGNVLFADFHAARLFAHKMNVGRDVARHPERAVQAGQVNAMGLIDETLHLVVARYRETVNRNVMADALVRLGRELGEESLTRLLEDFVDQFPPPPVYRGELSADAYLAGATGDVGHREVVLEELLLLWLANANPAFAPFRELYDDRELRSTTPYESCIERLGRSMADEPPMPGVGVDLFELLQQPMRAAPDSLQAQLDFIRGRWSDLVGPGFVRLLLGLDLIAEESRPFFGPGPGPVEVPVFGEPDESPEAYSADLDWMPRLVLLAKNAYVWLDQLSRAHRRDITTLDEIPDDELDRLAGWGITGLWLIGVWERSRASARIKRAMGDVDAVASAYSLQDYEIAADLGGDAAFDDLSARAWRRGIRMSTDMVPNHVGIDSRWLVEHPDWFIGLDHSPFPSYSFDGQDLSDDDRVGVQIEDHYWDRSDAAVVFKRVDRWTGSERFIYHGNDGTSMPWNDTAQLDYRSPEVREAVIETILHVARRSPIIRFDAAMTLTKKHYQRLWFPEPGSGGDIPSRAEHGMTREQFDAAMPQEFWREVVDRVAAEAPDTLLLAEAFWLLEGYFVRTLGMHRVYNSAFMNMLRDERNAEYRQLIKSTLEYDPQILKRYVNFMSNPDERTAVDQFGTDDKYFGVATLMATLPGLPMFGHGQVEGYAEKYGMEFRRPRWDELPNTDLVQRHEQQLFPLLRRRREFADVEQFLLFDFYRDDGTVDENVFAYGNAFEGRRSLVLYHNRFADTRGWVRSSAAVRAGADGGLVQRSLGESLDIPSGRDHYLVFRDATTGDEYLRSCRELHERGLYAELHAYQCHVFLDFRVMVDDERQRCRLLAESLAGGAVPSVDEALAELELAPVLDPFKQLVTAALESLVDARVGGPAEEELDRRLEALRPLVDELLTAIGEWKPPPEGDLAVTADGMMDDLTRALSQPAHVSSAAAKDVDAEPAEARPSVFLEDRPDRWRTLIAWLLTRRLGEIVDPERSRELARRLFDELYLGRVLARCLGPGEGGGSAALVRMLLHCEEWWSTTAGAGALARDVEALFADETNRQHLGVNRFDDVLWFEAETLRELIGWLPVAASIATDDPERISEVEDRADRLAAAVADSGYRVEALLAALAEAK